ncbi:5-methylthioadenosine/S-adenosylhomocysteine deaminase [Amorphus suaedae]
MAFTLIKGGQVVTMDTELGDFTRADILIEDDVISAVGPDLDAPAGATVIEAHDRIVMPGFVNAHIHTWQTGLRGLGSDWTGTNYFRAMHAGLAGFFTPEDIYLANFMGALNQLNAGVTTLVDWHHNNPTPDHTDAAVDGLLEAGIRAVFLHGSPKPDPKPGQRPYTEIPMPRGEVERLRKGRLASDDALVTMGLAILGPQIGTEEVLLEDLRLGREFDLVTSMHHSQALMNAPDGYKRAEAEGLIDRRFNVVHGNEMTDADLTRLVDNGASFAVTAEVEMQMCYTDPLSGRLLAMGGPIALGSDVESAFAADMFAVTRISLQTERHLTSLRMKAVSGERPHPIPVTVKQALGWATMGGARAFRLEDRVGSLSPGKKADIVLLRADDMNMIGVQDPANAVVCYANPGNVDTVLVNGQVMKRDGKLLVDGLGETAERLIASGRRIVSDFRANAPTASFA